MKIKFHLIGEALFDYIMTFGQSISYSLTAIQESFFGVFKKVILGSL